MDNKSSLLHHEIIQKISKSGIEILKDTLKKSLDYNQSQHFITNNTISLDYQCSVENKTKKIYVNETNETITYNSLNTDCQNSIKKGNSKVKFKNDEIDHFKNLNFTYIDFGRNTKSQLEQLRGKFETVFGKSIIDHTAARDTLIFRGNRHLWC